MTEQAVTRRMVYRSRPRGRSEVVGLALRRELAASRQSVDIQPIFVFKDDHPRDCCLCADSHSGFGCSADTCVTAEAMRWHPGYPSWPNG